MKNLLSFFAYALALAAQTPAFDAASVKLNRSEGGPSSIRGSPGRIRMDNVSLRKLTLWAYGIPDDREYALIGPGWMGSESFTIEATFPAETSADRVRLMTRALLAERFKLAAHRETRQLPMYVLVVDKDGLKIQPVEGGQPRTAGGPGRLEAHKITMQKLADLLARGTGHQVVDGTGVKGVFDFTLQWTPEEAPRLEPDAGAAGGEPGPPLSSALREQLGLRLETRKGPVDVLVVDHMERVPTAN